MLSSKDFIAIDLSSHDLKIAQLVVSPGKKEILNLVNQSIQDLSEDDVAKSIKQVLKELGIVNPRAIAVIPSFLTITKNIEIPSCDPNEIKEIINLQACRHTPYSREEIIIDYINIGTYKQNYSKVLLVIATRSVIRRQIEILHKAGLNVDRMAFAPEGICNVISKGLRLSSQDSSASIIHVDAAFTDFMITHKDKVIFIRNIPIGVEHLSREREKYEPKFVDEVRKSQEAYTSEDIEKPPVRFFLTGAVDNLGYLTEILNATLNTETEILNYFDYLSASQKAVKMASFSSNRMSFLNASSCLLAQEEVKLDLVPEEIKLEKQLQQRGREVIKAGILVMAAFVLIYCILLIKIYFKGSYLRKLSLQYKSTHKEAQELEANFTKNQIIRDSLSSRGLSLEVLSEFYNALPLDIRVSYIKFDIEGNFSIEGTAETMSTIFSFVDNLGKSSYFKKVETRYTRSRKEKDNNVTDFALSCTLSTKVISQK